MAPSCEWLCDGNEVLCVGVDNGRPENFGLSSGSDPARELTYAPRPLAKIKEAYSISKGNGREGE